MLDQASEIVIIGYSLQGLKFCQCILVIHVFRLSRWREAVARQRTKRIPDA